MFNESYTDTSDAQARARWHLRDANACMRFMRMYSTFPAPVNIFWVLFQLPWYLRLLPAWWRGDHAQPSAPSWSNSHTFELEIAARNRYVELERDQETRDAAEKASAHPRHQRELLERRLRETEKIVRELRDSSNGTQKDLWGRMDQILDKLVDLESVDRNEQPDQMLPPQRGSSKASSVPPPQRQWTVGSRGSSGQSTRQHFI